MAQVLLALGRVGGRRVVGDEDDRDAVLFVERSQEREDLVAGRRVEVAGGLVGEQHAWLVREGARDRDTLLLATRELRGKMAGARAEAQQIHRRLLAGADFAELARLHSGDRSAAQGGSIDYTHRGMLPEAVHGVVDKLALGGLSEPVQLLEGVVILRLDGRRAAQQRSFEQVRARAADLWQRAEGEARWKALIAGLRQGTAIRIDESHYGPQRSASEKPRAG